MAASALFTITDGDLRVLHRIPADPRPRQHLLTTFADEPASSRDALRARLEWLLLIPELRAMLCADSCLPGSALLAARLTIIDIGGAPQGCLAVAHTVGEFLLTLLSGAVFTRQLPAKHVMIVVDEWQELVRAAGADEVERLLAQARFKKVNLVLVNQTLAQVSAVSPALMRSLLANVALSVGFRPDAADIKHLIPLLPATGRTIDPDHPDRLLSAEDERRRLIERLARLPPRHALLGDLVSGSASVIRTLDVPFEQARRRAAQVDARLRERFEQGRYGVPVVELIEALRHADERIPQPLRPGIDLGQGGVSLREIALPEPPRRSAQGRQRTGRPPLVLP